MKKNLILSAIILMVFSFGTSVKSRPDIEIEKTAVVKANFKKCTKTDNDQIRDEIKERIKCKHPKAFLNKQ